MNARSKRMATLTSRLQRSIARKTEVEDMIASELQDVAEKLSEELTAEQERRADLDSLLQQVSTRQTTAAAATKFCHDTMPFSCVDQGQFTEHLLEQLTTAVLIQTHHYGR